MVPQEFQAVVFAAGRGSRFAEVCSQRPKCLLPIGNLPMIWYPLNMLHKIGFTGMIPREDHDFFIESLGPFYSLQRSL